MRLRRIAACAFWMSAMIVGQLNASVGKGTPSIVGVWQLDEFIDYEADGTPVRPLGHSPTGMFIYTPSGQLSIQIMKTPPSDRSERRQADAERLGGLRGYLAYFGSYEIDYASMTVTHKVQGALNSNYVHSNHEHVINLNGETLEINISEPDGRGAYRRLTRIERFGAPSPDLSELAGLNDPRHFVLKSKVVGRDYQVFVRLPEAYDSESTPYPVVYLLDGDITFPMLGAYERYLSFYGETPDVILVGIGYGARTRTDGNRRTYDYTVASPTRDDTGGAENFQKMLETEAFPLIEANYNADPDKRIIFGQSLGGQFVLYSALTRPDLFWGHIASNPAIQDNAAFFMGPDFDAGRRAASRLFVVSGSDERERYAQPMRAWRAHWVGERAKPWMLKTVILDGHSHVSIGPAAYRAGMAWLFKASGEEK